MGVTEDSIEKLHWILHHLRDWAVQYLLGALFASLHIFLKARKAKHISIVDGKIVLGVEAGVDLVDQLEKLRGAHTNDLIGGLLTAAEDAIKVLSPAAPAAPSA